MTKHTDGLNDRLRDATLAQGGSGISLTRSLVEMTEEETACVQSRMMAVDLKGERDERGRQPDALKHEMD